ncbi:hypothetical protein Tco_0472848, partial [Tanacetum coccineum]
MKDPAGLLMTRVLNNGVPNRRAIPDYLTWRHSCSCVSDDLSTDGYNQNDVEQLCAHLICLREIREELVLSHTTAPAAEGAMILLPTPDEIARVRSTLVTTPEPGQPSKKRRLRKRSSEAGSSALELGQAEGVDEADLTDFCAEIENSMERDEGTSARASLTPTPHLDKRLGAPPFMADVSASGPSHGRTLVHASTSGRGLSLGGAVVSAYAGKSGAKVLWHQMDSLDSLDRSALAQDV